MRWYISLIWVGLIVQILVGTASALNESTGFEKNTVFVDHLNISIIEKVENHLGLSCNDCNVFLTLLYPNNNFLVANMNMTLLNSTISNSHYNATINNATTLGTYLMIINATNVAADGLHNGTSDRAFIRVVDVYPEPQSDWEFGLIMTLTAISFIMIFISNKHETQLYKQLFFLMGITMPLLVLFALYAMISSSVGASSNSAVFVVRMAIAYLTFYFLIFGIIILNAWKEVLVHMKNIKIKIK